MIERIKSPMFIMLNKNCSLDDAKQLAILCAEQRVLSLANCREGKDADVKPMPRNPELHYYEVNSKNMEFSTIIYFRSDVVAGGYCENSDVVRASDEVLKAMEELGLADIRIRLIAFRVGAKTYCVSESWLLHKDSVESLTPARVDASEEDEE